MNIFEAIGASNCFTAERPKDRGNGGQVVAWYAGRAPIEPSRIRKVRGVTDHTAAGKLSKRQLQANAWEPVNVSIELLA